MLFFPFDQKTAFPPVASPWAMSNKWIRNRISMTFSNNPALKSSACSAEVATKTVWACMVEWTEFHVRQATLLVVDCTVESGWQESTPWNPWKQVDDLPRKGKEFIPCKTTFSMIRMIQRQTFLPNYESINGGRGNQATKNAKKQTQRRRRMHVLYVDAIAFDVA